MIEKMLVHQLTASVLQPKRSPEYELEINNIVKRARKLRLTQRLWSCECMCVFLLVSVCVCARACVYVFVRLSDCLSVKEKERQRSPSLRFLDFVIDLVAYLSVFSVR